MKRFLAITILLATLGPIAVHAHSVFKQSQPQNGATLDTPPPEFSMEFSDNIRLTAVTMDGQSIALPEQDGFAATFSVPLPEIAPGAYSLEWRGLSVDGHVMKGAVTFSVQ